MPDFDHDGADSGPEDTEQSDTAATWLTEGPDPDPAPREMAASNDHEPGLFSELFESQLEEEEPRSPEPAPGAASPDAEPPSEGAATQVVGPSTPGQPTPEEWPAAPTQLVAGQPAGSGYFGYSPTSAGANPGQFGGYQPPPYAGATTAYGTGVAPTPPPPKRSRLTMVAPVAAAVVLVAIIVGVSIFWVNRNQPTTNSPVIVTQTVDAPSTQPASTPSASGSTSASPSSAAGTIATTEEQAVSLLGKQRDQDLPTVPMDGQWTIMLSSKWVGATDQYQTTKSGSHTFMALDIWEQYLQLKKTMPSDVRIVMFYGSDYNSRMRDKDGKTIYAVSALGSWASRAAADAWCQARFPDQSGQELLNSCYPIQLSR